MKFNLIHSFCLVFLLSSITWAEENPLFFKFGQLSPKKGSFDHVRLNSIDNGGNLIEIEVEKGQFTKLGSLYLENVKIRYRTPIETHFHVIQCQRGRMDALSLEFFLDGNVNYQINSTSSLKTEALTLNFGTKIISSFSKVKALLGKQEISGEQFYFNLNKRILKLFHPPTSSTNPSGRYPAQKTTSLTKIQFSKNFQAYKLIK